MKFPNVAIHFSLPFAISPVHGEYNNDLAILKQMRHIYYL